TRWPRDWSSDVCSSDLGFRVGNKDYQGSGMALLLSFRNPDDPTHVVSVFYGLSPEAVKPVSRLLFFYGWNSYLVFENGTVIAREIGRASCRERGEVAVG